MNHLSIVFIFQNVEENDNKVDNGAEKNVIKSLQNLGMAQCLFL